LEALFSSSIGQYAGSVANTERVYKYMAEQSGYRTTDSTLVTRRGAGPSESEETQDISIDFAAALHVLMRNGRIVLGTALSVFVLSVAVAFLMPSEYTSIASFIPPNSNSNSGAAALLGQLSAVGGGGLGGVAKSSADTYAGILKSRSVADELISRFDLKKIYGKKTQSEAVKRLASMTFIDIDQKSSIVTVSVTDRSPERARDLTNGYLDALREANGRLALTESSQRRVFFKQQLDKEKDDLEDAEVELKKTEEQSGLIAPTGQTAVEIETIAQTRAQIALREVELAALSQSATDQNSEVVRLRSEIEDLQRQLSRLLNGGSKGAGGTIPTSKVPELQLEYVRKEREVKYHEALFEMLAKQYEQARMDEAHDAPLLQVLDSASYPDSISSPHRIIIISGGLFLGLLAGCGWVLARERTSFIQSSVPVERA
jgi:tyrosine-protein kinase Etk/Wzc